jgi:hypothetical protein
MVGLLGSLAALRRITMPSPPLEKSTCWKTRGMMRGSRFSWSMKRGSMSSVAQPMWTLPEA